jgi:formylglycine-generating enzyme required for sulfatase activity
LADGAPDGVAGEAWRAGDEPQGRGVFDPAASVGVFVGVSIFEDSKILSVPFAVDDAVDLAHLFTLELGLIAPRRALLLLSGEPRKTESLSRLARLLEAGARRKSARQVDIYDGVEEIEKGLTGNGLAVFTVATHGLSDQGGDFLVAADSRKRRQLQTGVPVAHLVDEVTRAVGSLELDRQGKSVSRRGLVLLDACRGRLTAGTRGAAEPELAKGFAEAIARARGLAVLSGATLGGLAYDDPERQNGVFTCAVLDGLRGTAPPGPEGWITVRTLADFVQERVVEWVKREWPNYSDRSLGIERKIEGTAESLPLAPHPEALRERKVYRARREAALGRVKENLGEVLTGAHWSQIWTLLPQGAPTEDAERLLDQIEGLNGTELTHWGLREYLRERAAEAAEPPSKVDPPPIEVPPARALSTLVAVPREPAPPSVALEPGAPKDGDRQQPAPAREPRLVEAKPWWKARGWKTALLVLSGLVLLILGALALQRGLFGSRDEPENLEATAPVPSSSAPGSLAATLENVLSEAKPAGSKASEPTAAMPDSWRTRILARAEKPPAAGTAEDGPLGMRFRYVPSGTYTIGSPKDEPGRFDDEKQHQVKLSQGVWLAETEVTQAQWSQLVKEQPWSFKNCGDDCPVENVSWYAAAEFANRLSNREALAPCYQLAGCKGGLGGAFTCEDPPLPKLDCPGYRLPTEAEWEVAARAGTKTAIYTGGLSWRSDNDAPKLETIAWYGGNSEDKSHPVGKKRANAWGFHDLLGNVYEWTGDRFGEYQTGLVADPCGPSQGEYRVFRGGSWYDGAPFLRAADRSGYPPSNRWNYLGFRLARATN